MRLWRCSCRINSTQITRKLHRSYWSWHLPGHGEVCKRQVPQPVLEILQSGHSEWFSVVESLQKTFESGECWFYYVLLLPSLDRKPKVNILQYNEENFIFIPHPNQTSHLEYLQITQTKWNLHVGLSRLQPHLRHLFGSLKDEQVLEVHEGCYEVYKPLSFWREALGGFQ